MIRITNDPPAVWIGERQVRLLHHHESLEVQAECLPSDLRCVHAADLPPRLQIKLKLDDSEQVPAAYGYDLLKIADGGDIGLSICCGEEGGIWRDHVAIGAVYQAMMDLPNIEMYSETLEVEFDAESSSLYISATHPQDSEEDLFDFISRSIALARNLVTEAESEFFGFLWNTQYDIDEPLFTKDLLIPMLRKLGYRSVRYNHGVNEYGRDIIFSETDKFGRIRHLGAQVKAGNVGLGNRKQLDLLISQIDDAFSMPVDGPDQSKRFYISDLYVFISGSFTDNATSVITQKVNPRIVGSLHFLDRSDLEGIVNSLWPLTQ